MGLPTHDDNYHNSLRNVVKIIPTKFALTTYSLHVILRYLHPFLPFPFPLFPHPYSFCHFLCFPYTPIHNRVNPMSQDIKINLLM